MGLTQWRELSAFDRFHALALQEAEDDECSGCGQPRSESMDPANERAYVGMLPHRCFACTARERRMKEYEQASQPGALFFGVVKRVRKKLATQTAKSSAQTGPPPPGP